MKKFEDFTASFDNDYRAGRFSHALDEACFRIQKLQQRVGTDFPHGWTVGNVYALRDLHGQPLGSNVGWSSGFWTGLLLMAEHALDRPMYRPVTDIHIKSFSHRVRHRVNLDHHDLGFLYMPSCVAVWNKFGDKLARVSAIEAADCMLERYLPKPGIFQAWGEVGEGADSGRMIIDCLLNLPLLFWAHQNTGDARYYSAAKSHLEKSLTYSVRADYSSYHTYHFDASTGQALGGGTAQGLASGSCWSRGQAWGIYGFALNYRYVKDQRLLIASERMAKFFVEKLGENRIPLWDFSLSYGEGHLVDSSAAAIAVCGLLELASFLPDERAIHWRRCAYEILEALIQECAVKDACSNAILSHGVYSVPHGKGIDEASLWGDYFYVEALSRIVCGWRSHW